MIKVITKFLLICCIVIGILYFGKLILKMSKEIFKEEHYYYECIDTFGNEVICEKIYNSYGQLWGITSDGTAVQITKGKKVEGE